MTRQEKELQSSAPPVSIIVPVYNVEQYLEECLDSILRQDYQNFEVICIDDGSTDNSLPILQKYAARDHRFKVFPQKKNSGLGPVRNSGLREAAGQYVYFLDSDDKIAPQMISQCVQKCEENRLDILAFCADLLLEEGTQWSLEYEWPQTLCDAVFTGSELIPRLLEQKKFLVSIPIRFFRREFLTRENLLFPEGIIHEDLYFAAVTMLMAERVMLVNQKFYIRRVHAGSIMTNINNDRAHLIKSAYGYWKSIILLRKFITNNNLSIQQCRILIRLLSSWEQNVRKKIRQIPDENSDEIAALSDLAFYVSAMSCRQQPTDAEIQKLNAELRSIKKDCRQKERRIQELTHSRSYRIGRWITWLPRLLKGRINAPDKQKSKKC